MKKLFKFLFLLSFVISFSGCGDDYDDSLLRGEIDEINNEIGDIKSQLEALKKQVTSVETIVDALNKGKVVSQVEELSDGKGYKITFNDATTIEVLRGGNASAVSVQEVDGVYYWTVITNGKAEVLLDGDGNEVVVSSSKLSLDTEGYWTLNDKRITDANGDYVKFSKGGGDSFFKDIIVTETSVTFVLADDSTIVIPKTAETFLAFDTDDATPFYLLKAGKQTNLKIKFSSDLKNLEVISKPEGWTTNVHRPDKYVAVTPPADAAFGIGEIRLQGIDKNGLVYLAIARVSIEGSGFSDPEGVYILNEGNMTTENGSLIYIDPTGKIFDYVYRSINGVELGNVTQDMYIYDEKMYIISQNGKKNAVGLDFENEGRLVVANSKTMKREAVYDAELSVLSWPSHIAVLDEENIFIRDNKGVYLFNSSSKDLTLIDGSSSAKKNTMAVADGKVFASKGNSLIVLEKGKTTVSATIDMGAPVSGVIKSEDGNLWVSMSGSPSRISKVNSKTHEIMKTNTVAEVNLSASSAAAPAITAKGNTLYYSGLGSKIYRHDFITGETKLMIDIKTLLPNTSVTYNTIAVHPLTGKLYMNRLKAFGWDFLINNICVLKDTGDTLELEENYENYTHFPAGIFFPSNFQ